jgi:hypothetical protein
MIDMFTLLLLSTFLLTEPAKEQAKPEKKEVPVVTDAEQIKILQLQNEELAASVALLQAQMKRATTVNAMVDHWNKIDCKIEQDPTTGLLRCKASEAKKEEPKK